MPISEEVRLRLEHNLNLAAKTQDLDKVKATLLEMRAHLSPDEMADSLNLPERSSPFLAAVRTGNFLLCLEFCANGASINPDPFHKRSKHSIHAVYPQALENFSADELAALALRDSLYQQQDGERGSSLIIPQKGTIPMSGGRPVTIPTQTEAASPHVGRLSTFARFIDSVIEGGTFTSEQCLDSVALAEITSLKERLDRDQAEARTRAETRVKSTSPSFHLHLQKKL